MTTKDIPINEKIQHYNNNIRQLGICLNHKRENINLSIREINRELGIGRTTLRDFFNGNSVPHPVYCLEIMKYIRRKEDETSRKKSI